MQQEEKQWYTTKEAADFLGIPTHRLGRLRRQGRISGVVGGGENPRYAMYNIDELRKVDVRDLRYKKSNPSEEAKSQDQRGAA
jgi:hypothetical protein